MRIVLALLALIMTAPAASAQAGFADAALTVTVGPLEEALAAGHLVHVPVRLEYAYSTAGLATSPILISVKIAEAPPWLAASISPSTLFIPNDHPPSPGLVQRAPPQQVLLTLTAARDAPAGESAVLRLVAHAHPHNGVRGVTAEETALVATASSGCAAAPPAAEPAAEAKEGGDLSTATLGAAAPLSPGLLAGAAGLGALAGAGLGWRLRRR